MRRVRYVHRRTPPGVVQRILEYLGLWEPQATEHSPPAPRSHR